MQRLAGGLPLSGALVVAAEKSVRALFSETSKGREAHHMNVGELIAALHRAHLPVVAEDANIRLGTITKCW